MIAITIWAVAVFFIIGYIIGLRMGANKYSDIACKRVADYCHQKGMTKEQYIRFVEEVFGIKMDKKNEPS